MEFYNSQLSSFGCQWKQALGASVEVAHLVALQPYYSKGTPFLGWLFYKGTHNQKKGKGCHWATKHKSSLGMRNLPLE